MRALGRLELRTVECAGLVSLLTLAAGASQAANNVGWVLADQPTATIYTPSPKYTFNSARGSVSIERFGPNNYTVTFAKLYDGNSSEPSIVLVSAYGTSNRCITGRASSSGSSVVVNVQCFTSAGGQNYDTPFTLLYQSRGADFGNTHEGVAYVTTVEGSNLSNDSFDSSGDLITFYEKSKGNYYVTFPGLANGGGTIQVTPNGTAIDPAGFEARCKVVSRTGSSSTVQADVHCYSSTGGTTSEEFANANFNIGYAVGESLGVVGGVKARAAWAFADNATSTNVYTPTLGYQYNGFGTGHLTAQKTGTGQYTVTIPGTVSYGTSNGLVTAYGAGSNYCNIAGWTTNAISVACYNQSGVPADSQFDVSFQTAH